MSATKPLKIFLHRVDQLSEEEYALARKKTFGASDVASLFGLGFKTLEELIAEKNCPTLTEEEKKIGQLPSVRKGRELEDFILNKYKEETNENVYKPLDMYEVMPGLTVNFDGINEFNRPVEIKYITTYGTKYWTRSDTRVISIREPFVSDAKDIKAYIEAQAAYHGVPAYYYTQLQTQIMALEADSGQLCALFEKDWELQIYVIPADKRFARELKLKISKVWPEIGGVEIPKVDESTFEY